MGVQDVFEYVVSVDDAAGAEFIGMVVGEFLADLAEVNAEPIGEALAVWSLDRVQVAKRALGRSYVESAVLGELPDEGVLQQARWIAGIEDFVSKAATSLYEPWRKGFVTRDDQGRFSKPIDQTQSIPLSAWSGDKERAAPAFRPLIAQGGLDSAGSERDVKQQMERFQYQWEMAAHLGHELKDALKSGGKVKDGDFDFALTVLDPMRGIRVVRVGGDKLRSAREGGFDVKGLSRDDRPEFTDSILSIEVVPSNRLLNSTESGAETTRARIAAFNTLGGAGGSKLASLAFTDDKLLQQLSASLQLDPKRMDQSFLSRLFDVMNAGGSVLGQVSGFERAGQAAQLVGVLGPQAEQVLGPYVKRAAYRYRGTETTPDPMLRRELASGQMAAVDAIASGEASARDFEGRAKDNLLLGDALAWERKGVRGDALRMKVRADAASVNLAGFIDVDPLVAELSVESGQVLPSHGIILDADGRVVSQSVGFTDDHYLPFDLTNLARLRGGQYVRTRQQGGLTGEDVFTAVMTGARQVQVLSRSGVFTLEFSPDFRGARGNSDKAYSMYSRYLQILDAVDNSQQYVQDIDEETKLQIRRRVSDEARTLGVKDPGEIRSRQEAAIDEERRKLKEPDLEGVYRQVLMDRLGPNEALRSASMEQMQQLVSRLPASRQRQVRGDIKDALSEERNLKASRLQLNGQGYALALQTLKEQFPYFISRVDYRQIDELPFAERQRRAPTRAMEADRGYALPGALRSRSVRSGFYETGSLEPESKQGSRQPLAAPSPGAAPGGEPGAVPAAVAGSGAANAPAVAGSSPVVLPGAAGARVRDSSRARKELEGRITDFGIEMQQVAQAESVVADLTFDQVKDRPMQLVAWLASGGNKAGAVREAIENPESLQALVSAFSDEAAAKRGINGAVSGVWGNQFFEVEGFTPFGADSRAGAVDGAYDAIAAMLDLGVMRDVQVPARGAEGSDERLFSAGALPQAQPVISDLATKEQFQAFASDPANGAVMALAQQFLRGEGDRTRSLVQVAGVAGERLEALKALRDARNRRASEGRPGDGLTGFGISAAQAEALVGPDGDDDDLEALASDDELRAAASLAQRAWTLVNVGRSIEFESGGELFPKKGQWELFKAAAPAAPLVRIVPVGSPLQVAVARWAGTLAG